MSKLNDQIAAYQQEMVDKLYKATELYRGRVDSGQPYNVYELLDTLVAVVLGKEEEVQEVVEETVVAE